MDLKHVSANWKKLKTQLKTQDSSKENLVPSALGPKRKRQNTSDSTSTRISTASPRKKLRNGAELKETPRAMQASNESENNRTSNRPVSNQRKDSANVGLSQDTEIGKFVAVDCEMVGVGRQPGLESALARVSIVNYDGDQIYDSYVTPKETVTDWRTHVSGIMPKHMAAARSFEEVQKTVSDILRDRILIGHSISHDLNALLLSHPRRDIRDTARHPAYRKLAGGSSPRLKILASELLGVSIQTGEHSSIEDARACMMLFRRDKAGFEREHSKKYPALKASPSTENGAAKTNHKKKKKKKK